MFFLHYDKYKVGISNEFPSYFKEIRKRASFVDNFFSPEIKDPFLYISVALGNDWPFFVCVRYCDPYPSAGFDPGIVVVPESDILFIGVGKTLLCYNLLLKRKLWEEDVVLGFWGWHKYNGYIIMSSEVEMAVWDIYGKKCWSRYVDPPWEYTIKEDYIHLQDFSKGNTLLSMHDGSVI